jgi:hypothetical protein
MGCRVVMAVFMLVLVSSSHAQPFRNNIGRRPYPQADLGADAGGSRREADASGWR